MRMEIDIYGFKARVYKDGRWLIGEIPRLHIHDQAKSIRELENELKDAVDSLIGAAFASDRQKAAVKSPLLKGLLIKA